jgi:hypothetical protein
MAGIVGKPGLSGGDQARALARAKGEGGFCQRGPCLYFNEGEQTFSFGNQVNFTGFGSASLGENKPAFGGQGGGGESFGILTGGVGAPASQQAMGGWGLARHGAARAPSGLERCGIPRNSADGV